MATTYTTTNGDSGTNNGGGVYSSVGFILDSETGDSYSTSTNDGADIFSAESTVSLNSITLYSRVSSPDYDTHAEIHTPGTSTGSSVNWTKVGTAIDYSNVVLRIEINGTVTYSSTAIVVNGDTTQTGSLTNIDDLATLTFNFDNLQINTGTLYQATLFEYDAASDTYTQVALSLSASQNDAEDWYLYNKTGNLQTNSYGPTGMTVVTSSIPEPATASLSLLALAGLMARRRRKA